MPQLHLYCESLEDRCGEAAEANAQGMEMSVIPVFQSEIVPAAVRGLAVGSYQMSFGIGGFVITAICRRTSRIPNDWSWRIVFLCYLVGMCRPAPKGPNLTLYVHADPSPLDHRRLDLVPAGITEMARSARTH